MRKGQTVIVGIGNEYRRDDAAGLIAARRLRTVVASDVHVHDGIADGLDLINLWDGAGYVIVIDSMLSGAKPGTIRRFDALATPLPAEIFRSISTHLVNIPDAVSLAQAIGKLPQSLTVYGIESADMRYGIGLTPAVQDGVDAVTGTINYELRNLAKMLNLSDN